MNKWDVTGDICEPPRGWKAGSDLFCNTELSTLFKDQLPRKLAYPLKIVVWKIIFFLKWSLFDMLILWGVLSKATTLPHNITTSTVWISCNISIQGEFKKISCNTWFLRSFSKGYTPNFKSQRLNRWLGGEVRHRGVRTQTLSSLTWCCSGQWQQTASGRVALRKMFSRPATGLEGKSHLVVVDLTFSTPCHSHQYCRLPHAAMGGLNAAEVEVLVKLKARPGLLNDPCQNTHTMGECSNLIIAATLED